MACLGDMEAAMELRHLRYFIAVAEEGSLTLAAKRRLHTAQPSLSRQIRDLEYEVGVQLMRRSVHGIELTAAGRAFLDHARLALTQAEAAAEAARRGGKTGQADVRFRFPDRTGNGLAAGSHAYSWRPAAEYRGHGLKPVFPRSRRRFDEGQARCRLSAARKAGGRSGLHTRDQGTARGRVAE